MEKTFSIQFVSKVTKLNSHTIRAWEKRYKAIVPHRDENGRRVYSQANVDKLIKLNSLVSMGNAISDIAKLDDKYLDELYSKYSKKSHFEDQVEATGLESKKVQSHSTRLELDYNLVLQNLTMALSHFKLDIISHELEKIKKSISPRDFALNILQPLLMEVAIQVDSGSLSIGQEHALSAILKFHIGQMIYQMMDTPPRAKQCVLLATPEGELHEFGIMISALLCMNYGIKYLYLGTNLPATALADTANQIKCDIVILGVSKNYTHTPTNNIDNYIDELTALMSKKTKLWVGGAKINPKKRDVSVEQISTLQLLDNHLSKL